MATKTKKTVAERDDYFTLVHRCPLVPIRNNTQLAAAHAMIDELIRIPEKQLTDGQAQYLEVLGDLTIKYEYPLMAADLEKVTGLDSLKHLLEANDMKQSDLAELLGIGPSAVSMILSGQRPITAGHARILGKRFAVNPGLFIS